MLQLKMKYYSLKNILKKNARYNIIYGERSNGKTYAVKDLALQRFCEKGEQFALIRRWQDDFTGKRGSVMFDDIVKNGLVKKYSGGEWTDIYYHASRWYLCRYDDDGNRDTDTKPFAYGFAITAQEHDKSTSYPNVRTILFDEFLTRKGYIPDEFVLFCNVLSTIIRERDDVQIFMLGNTVNKFCPYFAEMGLTRVKDMKQGEIDVYQYGNSGLIVAVEYASGTTNNGKRGKPSDVYFAFDNPKLNMITSGDWELDIYPHCPEKYRPMDVVFTYFIEFDSTLLQCEIVNGTTGMFTYIHRKTTPIKNPDTDLIFNPAASSPRRNVRRSIKHFEDKLGEKIYYFFKNYRVFYQSNDIGDIVMNYMNST